MDNNQVGLFTAETCAKHMNPYVPKDSGTLSQNYTTKPWKVTYTSPYAHYQYVGVVYGPSYPIFENGTVVGFYSPKGKKKHPTEKSIKYSKKQHPLATSKWDKAAKASKGNVIAREIENFIKRGQFLG